MRLATAAEVILRVSKPHFNSACNLEARTVKHQHAKSTPDWGIPRHWQAHGFRREGLWI